ncbi:hypothetical protein [Inquilinus sp. OTU3971]|uniref:hypothetical protein n=1 Tax=Inquilinus sp. OTU3971 TaxID=3043855 RepID=UPI00313CA544
MDLYYIPDADEHLLVEKTLRMVILVDVGSGAQPLPGESGFERPAAGASAGNFQAILIGITIAGTRPAARFWNGFHAIDDIMMISAFLSTSPARAWASGRWH